MVTFTGLIACDIPGCETLVEPHAPRCQDCERAHGKHPEAHDGRGWTQQPGRNRKRRRGEGR